MSFGIAFYDRDGGFLKLEGSWRIEASPPRLVGEGVQIDLPPSLFGLDPTLTPEQLNEIRRQVEAIKK